MQVSPFRLNQTIRFSMLDVDKGNKGVGYNSPSLPGNVRDELGELCVLVVVGGRMSTRRGREDIERVVNNLNC